MCVYLSHVLKSERRRPSIYRYRKIDERDEEREREREGRAAAAAAQERKTAGKGRREVGPHI